MASLTTARSLRSRTSTRLGTPRRCSNSCATRADRRHLIADRLALSNRAHGFNKLPTSIRRRWRRAALVQAAAISKFLLRVVAEKIRSAHRAVGSRHRLILIVQVGKPEIMRLGEPPHVGEGVLRIAFGVVRADRGKAYTLCHQNLGILHDPIDDGFDVRAVVADEDDHRSLGTRDVLESVGIPVGGG